MPWLLPVIALVSSLGFLGVSAVDILRYGLYFVFCIIAPGVLLLRALCGSTGSWPEDVGLGAAIGFAYELAGWALFTATGLQSYLLAWPALVLVVFGTARSLHRYWRIGRPPRVPVAWHWGVASAITVAVILGVNSGPASVVLPPDAAGFYPDLLYHLSMVNQALHSVPPGLPQVSGQGLDYHWFANAHMASAVDITRIPSETVMLRLWILPVYVVSLLIFAALARQCSRVWWAGIVATFLTCGAQYVDIWPIRAGLGTSALTFYSPSLVYGTLIAAAAAVFLVDILYRGPAPNRVWILTIPLLIVAGGSKPTGLPLLLGGIGLAGLWQLIVSRRIPVRSVVAGLVLLVTMLVTLQTVVGSTAGSKFRLAGIARGMPGYVEATGDSVMAAGPGWTLPALTSGDSVAFWGALVVIATILVAQLTVLSGFAVLGHDETRRDPVAWFLVGVLVAALLALFLVDHPSASEIYFLRGALPFAATGSAWVLTTALRGRSRRIHGLLIGGGLLGGIVMVAIAATQHPDPNGSRGHRIAALGVPMAVLLAVAVVALVDWILARRGRPVLRGLGAGLVVVMLMGMALPSGWAQFSRSVGEGWPRAVEPAGLAASEDQVHPDEQRAALWLRDNSAPGDIVASNTACHPARRQPPCDARGYIVSGLAGRQTVLEGWAYTQQALAKHGVDGLPYAFQPSPWPDRAGILNRLFQAPNRQVVETLRTKYGVRWIYADLLAGRVAVKTLGRLAVLRHSEPSVLVYELVPPRRR